MRDEVRGRPVRVASTKYDGSLHQDLEARLLDGPGAGGVLRLYVAAGTAARSYRGEFVVRHGYTHLFWPGMAHWWNVEHFDEPVPFPHRPRMLTYANVASPARFDGETVSWIDLDLDVVVNEVGVRLIDEDEFEEHRERYGYPEELVRRAREAAETLVTLAMRQAEPFDRASYIR